MPGPSRREKERRKQQMRAFADQMVRPDETNSNGNRAIWEGQTMIDSATERPEWKLLDQMKETPRSEVEQTLRASVAQDPSGRLVPYLWCTLFRDDAKKLYTEQKYTLAIDKWKQAMRVYMGENAVLPSKDYLNDIYLAIGERDWRRWQDLVVCSSNIAQCYLKLGLFVEMIDWTEEVEIIYKCLRLVAKPHEPTWIDYHQSIIEYFTYWSKAQNRAYSVLLSLGNTSLASTFGHLALVNTTLNEGALNNNKIVAMRNQIDIESILMYRHPDPNAVIEAEVTQPTLQIRGVWKKSDVADGHRPPSRNSCSAWIWEGKMYVIAGVSDLYVEYRDAWCLNLSTMEWRRLPDMPPVRGQAGLSCSRLMRHWGSHAYLFTGLKKVWQFDMRTEKWTALTTTFTGTWPYPKKELTQFCSAIVDGKLYIFGGDDGATLLGCNTLMALDLETLRWEHISGTSANVPSTTEPNLRMLASMWAVPEQHKLYLLGGNANRSAAYQKHKDGGNSSDYTYTDFWSFDCVSSNWHRERWRGSFPCPRTEMASEYNQVLRRGIVYGGYNGSMNSAAGSVDREGRLRMYPFSFFGDTFIFDPETKLWQHVIVKGWPSYRAQATLISDPDTGITYLYGGYTNTEYVPMKDTTSRCFGDIWQLKLDMPGGRMAEEDRSLDPRTETMGPWRRCYTCGEAGLEYKRCSGTCGGRYFFCSVECQTKGWNQHKTEQGCRKA